MRRKEPTRYVVSATLLTCSPLAIHSGWGSNERAAARGERKSPFRQPERPWNAQELKSCDQLVIKDVHHRPYLPGSSLKGVFREYLDRDGGADKSICETLLGRPVVGGHHEEWNQDDGEGGAVIFEDAFVDLTGSLEATPAAQLHQAWAKWLTCDDSAQSLNGQVAAYAGCVGSRDIFPADSWRANHETLGLLTSTRHLPYFSPKTLTYVDHMVGIDRRTGTARETTLFTSECVPAGIPFHFRTIVDHGVDAVARVKVLLGALAGFNVDLVHAPVQLGAGATHGWGRMACLFSTVTVRAWTPFGRGLTRADEIDPQEVLETALNAPPKTRRPRLQLNLRLDFEEPFLVNDPSKAGVLEAFERRWLASEGESKGKPPDHVPRAARVRLVEETPPRLWVTPLLPATGFKGPVRSQLERILRTIHDNLAVGPQREPFPITEKASAFVQQLFGFDGQRSGLECTEFRGMTEQDLVPNKREFVAIDRFTGGAAPGAKFDVHYLDRPQLFGAVIVQFSESETESLPMLGLLALLGRDLVEGDVSFGMGDTKGFGRCRASVLSASISATPTWLRQRLSGLAGHEMDHDQVANWLHRVVQRAAREIEQADELLNEGLKAVRQAPPPAARSGT